MTLSRRLIVALCLALLAPSSAIAADQQGVSANEIVLGTHQDLSGPVTALGSSLRDGLILAVDEINSAGGIYGRKIRLIVEDSGFDPKKAILATQKMLESDHIFALIAPLGSAPVAASMALVLDAGVPLLFSGTPADFTYKPYNKIKFGLAVPYGEQVRTQVKYAVEKLAKKRFGILYQDDETGQNVLRATEEQLKVYGMTLAARASYKRGDVDFSSQIARLKEADVDVVILGTIIRETAAAMIEARKQGWPVEMMVNQAGMNSAVVKIGGESVEGLYAMAQFLSINAQEQNPALADIVRRYNEKFGKAPDDGMIYGYVAMMLFAEGAKKAGPNLTADSLAQGLEQVKDFKTAFVGSPVSFGHDVHLGSRATILTQVRGGKFLPITGPMTFD
jgi:ABC-type branched-subunit amino acid transport system substrate-binding protein